MENGVGIGDWSHLGEKNGVQDVGMELKADEIAVDGSDGSRDSEGDEVFEEATDAEMLRIDVKDVPTKEDEKAENNWNLGDSLEVDGNFDAGHEIEKFEEAVEVANDVQNLAEEAPIVVHEKMEDLVTGEPFNEAAVVGMVDEQSAPDKVVRDELNLSENDGLVDDGKDEAREISDLGVDGEIEILKDGYEVSEKSDVVLEKSENGVLDNVNMDGTLVHENLDATDVENQELQVHEELETGDANEVEGGDIDSRNQIESNGENFLEVDKNVEVNETSSILDTGHQDNKNRELEDASAGLDNEYLADKVVESEGNLINTDTELKDYKTMELKEEVLTSQGQGHQDDKKLEEQDTSANLDLVDQDDRTGELKDTSAPIESKHREESSKPEDNLYTSVQERTLTLEVARPPSLEDSMVEKDEKIQASVSDLGTENTRGSQPSLEDSMVKKDEEIQASISDLGIENSKSSQPQSADVSVEASSALADKLGKKEAKDEEVKQSTLGKGEQEIRPAENVSSSSIGKYTNSAPSPARPAGLGRAAPFLEPAPRVVQPRVNGTVSQMQSQPIEDPTNGEAEENDETREKLQMIRVKFLRLARRLGQTPHNVVVAQVLYRLGLAEQLRGRNGSRVAAFSFERASAMAEQLEAAGQEPLDFSCTIMVLGKSGVGKSATINSIFDENKFSTDAFQLGTKKVQDVVGTVHGIKVRVIDTPGLLLSSSDQHHNEKMLHSVKRFIQKSPPDIVLYLDRLDMQSRDFGDMPLLRTITDIFEPSIWFNAIVVLTHAASAPPEGPNGTATSYDMFVTQRSHVVQQAIRQAAGDMRLMNPVSLVENHSACRTNRAGQRVLPNGQVWKPHLLLLSFASKILAEANTLLKLQDSPPGKPFATRTRAPPLPFLLSTLLQSRPQLKLPQEQFGDDDDTLDGDLDESSDSDDESEYDELPPFKRLTKAQLAKLTKAQKKAYYDELEYREKLFMKKQLKEEKKRRKMMKKMAALAKDLPSDYSDNVEEESSGAASVPVPLPDLALPASFDSENPTHRYRSLDSSTNQWLVRPVLDSHGWDHDVGYEGINVEKLFVVKDNIPVSFSGQVTKDKKDANLQMEVASSLKHGEGKATTLGFDMQTLGKDIAYTLRNETRFSNYKRNKATAGLSVTQIGDALTAGVKVEDKLIVNKRSQLVMSGGAIISRGDIAYGGSLEATLRDKDHPLGRFLSTIGLSVMDWHGDLVLGWNAQTQIPVGRSTNLIGRANLNNRGSGQVSIRLNSSEQLQIALICLVPLLNKLLGYSQSVQFGH